jgi:hypothetical protein
MARDKALEALIGDEFEDQPGITAKGMFGGWAWLWNGNLVCAARVGGMLVRLGKDNDGWVLAMDGVAPMMMRDKPMNRWLRASPEVYANDAMRQRLLRTALDFVHTLPPKT